VLPINRANEENFFASMSGSSRVNVAVAVVLALRPSFLVSFSVSLLRVRDDSAPTLRDGQFSMLLFRRKLGPRNQMPLKNSSTVCPRVGRSAGLRLVGTCLHCFGRVYSWISPILWASEYSFWIVGRSNVTHPCYQSRTRGCGCLCEEFHLCTSIIGVL
jgi:hypothetical protein